MGLIDPLSELWGDDPLQWIFRGHGDARWALIPSALRSPILFGEKEGSSEILTNDTWVDRQIRLLKQFFDALDRRGLPIPDDGPGFREDGSKWQRELQFELSNDPKEPWPPEKLFSLMALAQHYGLPTSLLDWTRQSSVAAFFAARECARRSEEGTGVTEMAVWAFNTRAIPVVLSPSWPECDRIQIVRAPYASNPNLHAQAGAFTVHSQILGVNEAVAPVSLDMAVQRIVATVENERSGLPCIRPAMRCLRLNAQHVLELLKFLSFRGIDAGAVFPGHRGAAQAVLDEWRWGTAGMDSD